MALKQFFVGRKCTVLLLDDRIGDTSDQQLQSIVHGVISLDQLAPVYGAARRRLRVIKFRGTCYRGGYHDFSIERGGLVVYPRLVATEHEQTFPRETIKSGVVALDALLGDGLERGTSTLLVGPAGSGKSTLAVQYAAAAAKRGDHAVVFMFDESVNTLSIRTNALGIGVERGVGPGQVRIQQIEPTEMTPGQFAHLVSESVEQHQARVVVIDSLNGYLNAMPEEHFLTARLHELLSYLGRHGVTTIVIAAQHGLIGGDISANEVDSSYLADCVVLLRYFEYGGEVRKAVSVVKKRTGIHERTIRELKFSERGIEVGDPLTQFRGVLTGAPEFTGAKEADR